VKIFQRIQGWAKELKRDVLVLWFALKNPETPLIARAVAFITVAYALSPIDLIPDFVPILGYLDDLILIPIFIWITIKLVPDDVRAQSRKQVQEWLESNQLKPKSYLGLIIILLIWLLLIWVCAKSYYGDMGRMLSL
jgi:uncharacterized membrane protein YkvA (DUF1232 family)